MLTAVVAAASAACAMSLVSQHTIDVVRTGRLLPRWDLATHLGHGWFDYHLLISGRIHTLLWDLWQQGYWPPGLSIYLVPFYLLLGGDITSGLWSSAVAFTLAATVGAVIPVRQWGSAGFLSAALFVGLMVSSPFLLAYASVAMTEMLGALAQLLVVLAVVIYQQQPTAGHARVFALSLTALFFVKYNYLLLLGVPLVLHEWLALTSGWRERLTGLGRAVRRILGSVTGVLLVLYAALLVAISATGGWVFEVAGQRISMRSVGSSGHLVLYGLLMRLWYLHRRGRIDWAGLTALDPRVRPLLLWFVIPVTVWLAAPYPNHLRDVANLVINRPLGESSVQAGLDAYLDSLRSVYFYSPGVFAVVLVAFAIAALRYRRQPNWMQWLILAIPLQAGAIVFHQTRFTRFLLLTVVLLCLVAASEISRWLSASRRGPVAGGVLVPVVLLAGLLAARGVVTETRFLTAAFEHYTASDALATALADIRRDLDDDDRLVIIGQSNDLAPATFRWALGPPSGVACFPYEAAGAARLDPARATKVLLLAPLDPAVSTVDPSDHYDARRREVLDGAERGDFALHRVFNVPDLQVTMSLYGRTPPPSAPAPCR